MGKSGFNLKGLLSNKNTVTILAVVLGVVFLYIAYNMRVKQAIEPKSVPVANQDIIANQAITSDMIEYVEVTNSFVTKSPNLITSSNQLIGKKIAPGNSIPEHGFFFTDQIVSSDDNFDPTIANIPDGYTLFELKVDLASTYGNSIYPGNYIDLYLKAYDNGLLIYGKFIESIEVLDVRDSVGRHVFDGGKSSGTPSVLLFAVPDEMHLLLNKAKLLSGIEMYPVPRNSSYSENPSATVIKSEYLKNYVLSKSAVIPNE
ncbi:MAG: hypothetical protein IKX00_04985 [Bacilli bacterium]|nr:hypothetical protein [Bacilli bacterium]